MIREEVSSEREPAPADHALVAAARAGDRYAFERLVAPHLAAALGAARLIAGQPQDGADAVQDALLTAWRSLPQLRDPTLFPAWFRRIVVNAAIKVARRHHRIVELDLSRPAPDDELDRALNLRRLSRALARLDPADRAVLTLRHYWDLSVAEMSRVLDIPEGTVKSRTHHALRRLRAAYEAEDRR